MFTFEKLEVYQRAVILVGELDTFLSSVKGRVSHSIVDQLMRAASSIALIIAEGNGRWHQGEKKNFMVIARGSVFECVPVLQMLRARNVLEEGQYTKFYKELEEISKILSALINRFSKDS